jgi:hypothetical protein
MTDFTLIQYQYLVAALKDAGYLFLTFEELVTQNFTRSVILRHDVDKRPDRALKMAVLEAEMGVKASYHFRIGKESNNPDIIRKIVELGHEVAYHYEDLNSALKRAGRITDNKEIRERAIESFRNNLKYFRKFYPVRIISMHGDPIHSADNREIWNYFDYRTEGIICEPYLDIDYSNTLYLTDTGRRWNGSGVNIRDKIRKNYGITPGEPLRSECHLRSTGNIMTCLRKGSMPERLVLNTHPQRWTNDAIPWITELFFQNLKNLIKYTISAVR